MASLAFALIAAGIVSFSFKSTRTAGIVCVGLFTFLFPAFAAIFSVLAVLAFLFYYHHTH